MKEPDAPDGAEEQVVTVTEQGQVTIPERFQEKLGIDTPGRVCFRETENGKIVIEAVPSAADMRGFAAEHDASTDEPATEILREKREKESASDSAGRTSSGWRLSEWRTGRTQEEIDSHRELLQRADDLDTDHRTADGDE